MSWEHKAQRISSSKQPGPSEGCTWRTDGAAMSVKVRALTASPPDSLPSARAGSPRAEGVPCARGGRGVSPPGGPQRLPCLSPWAWLCRLGRLRVVHKAELSVFVLLSSRRIFIPTTERRPLRGPPGGPAVRSPCLHCRGHRFSPWSGTETPQASRHSKNKTGQWSRGQMYPRFR